MDEKEKQKPLTQDNIDKSVEGLLAGSESKENTNRKNPSDYKQIDFRRPDFITHSQLMSLQVVFELFISNFRTKKIKGVKKKPKLDYVSIDQLSLDEFSRITPQNSLYVQIQTGLGGSDWIIEIDSLIVYEYIDRLLKYRPSVPVVQTEFVPVTDELRAKAIVEMYKPFIDAPKSQKIDKIDGHEIYEMAGNPELSVADRLKFYKEWVHEMEEWNPHFFKSSLNYNFLDDEELQRYASEWSRDSEIRKLAPDYSQKMASIEQKKQTILKGISSIEIELFLPIIENMLHCLSDACGHLRKIDFKIRNIHSNDLFLETYPLKHEACVLAFMECSINREESIMNICMPVASIWNVFPKLNNVNSTLQQLGSTLENNLFSINQLSSLYQVYIYRQYLLYISINIDADSIDKECILHIEQCVQQKNYYSFKHKNAINIDYIINAESDDKTQDTNQSTQMLSNFFNKIKSIEYKIQNMEIDLKDNLAIKENKKDQAADGVNQLRTFSGEVSLPLTLKVRHEVVSLEDYNNLKFDVIKNLNDIDFVNNNSGLFFGDQYIGLVTAHHNNKITLKKINKDIESLDLLQSKFSATVKAGKAGLPFQDLLNMQPGYILELDKEDREPMDLHYLDRKIATGDIVATGDGYENYGFRNGSLWAEDNNHDLIIDNGIQKKSSIEVTDDNLHDNNSPPATSVKTVASKAVGNLIIGRAQVTLSEILELSNGSIIELDTRVGEMLEFEIEPNLSLKAQVIIINDHLGVRLYPEFDSAPNAGASLPDKSMDLENTVTSKSEIPKINSFDESIGVSDMELHTTNPIGENYLKILSNMKPEKIAEAMQQEILPVQSVIISFLPEQIGHLVLKQFNSQNQSKILNIIPGLTAVDPSNLSRIIQAWMLRIIGLSDDKSSIDFEKIKARLIKKNVTEKNQGDAKT